MSDDRTLIDEVVIRNISAHVLGLQRTFSEMGVSTDLFMDGLMTAYTHIMGHAFQGTDEELKTLLEATLVHIPEVVWKHRRGECGPEDAHKMTKASPLTM